MNIKTTLIGSSLIALLVIVTLIGGIYLGSQRNLEQFIKVSDYEQLSNKVGSLYNMLYSGTEQIPLSDSNDDQITP